MVENVTLKTISWLNKFKKEFRRLLDTEQYEDHKEIFNGFSNQIPYIELELLSVYYSDALNSYELRIHENNYGDSITQHSLVYKDPSLEEKEIDRLEIQQENWYKEQASYLMETSPNDYEIVYPLHTFRLPLNFYERDVRDFIKSTIDSTILKKLIEHTKDILHKKCLNRLSLISNDEIKEIIAFLDDDWTCVDEKLKTEMFAKIFYYLGFEIIPLELLLSHDKFKKLNSLSHPELIAYDLSSNIILLIEELAKLTKEYLYKKDTVNSIINMFSRFFLMENRKVKYILIVNSEVKIDKEHYNLKEKIILKEDFVDKMKLIFNKKELKVILHENRNIQKIIKELIDFLMDN